MQRRLKSPVSGSRMDAGGYGDAHATGVYWKPIYYVLEERFTCVCWSTPPM
jgi:hypothetical protein